MAQDRRIMFPVDDEFKAAIEKRADALGLSVSGYIKNTLAADIGVSYSPSQAGGARDTALCPHGMAKSRCSTCIKAYHKNRNAERNAVWAAYAAAKKAVGVNVREDSSYETNEPIDIEISEEEEDDA